MAIQSFDSYQKMSIKKYETQIHFCVWGKSVLILQSCEVDINLSICF